VDNVASLFIKIRDTMPQGNSGTVRDEVKIDILAYILQQNDFPAGNQELPLNMSALEDIRMARKGIWDGVFTTDQAELGRAALSQNGCNGCHGADLTGAKGPALKGDRFVTEWENGSVNRLFLKIRETMPPLNAQQVTPAAKLDIVAYLLQVNGFPAGSTPFTLNDLEDLQIVKRDTASGPPNFTLVGAVGCLTQDSNNRWILTNASDPVQVRDEIAPPEALKRAASARLGTQTFDLVSVGPSMKPESHKNQKVEVRGLLYRDPKYLQVNLSSLETVRTSCPD